MAYQERHLLLKKKKDTDVAAEILRKLRGWHARSKLDTGVTGSTTERREIRNFPYPSVFELTGRQRLTVKRGIRNVGQLRQAR